MIVDNNKEQREKLARLLRKVADDVEAGSHTQVSISYSVEPDAPVLAHVDMEVDVTEEVADNLIYDNE